MRNLNFEPSQTNIKKDVVIVTGSSGLIGSAIIKRLAGKFELVGLDRDGPPYPPVEAECIPMDITDDTSISRAFDRILFEYGNRLTSVIHLAAFYDFSGKPSHLYEDITVKGTAKLLNVLQQFKVDQFIFSSTNLIYKPTQPGIKITENCPVEANWAYPESKINTEKEIQENKGSINTVILRIAGIYDEWCHSIPLSHQIQRIYEKQFTSHFYSGNVNHGNVFLHLEDMIDALESTIAQREVLPENIAINIGEPETPTYEDLQETLGILIHGEKWKTFEIPKPIAKAGAWAMDIFGDPFIKPWMIDRADDHYELDVTLAGDALNWYPKHALLSELPLIIDNLKKDPLKWYKENKLDIPMEMKESETHHMERG